MVTLKVNVPLALAILMGELVSLAWYNYVRPDNDRYLVTGLICDVCLAFVLHYILKHHWVFSGWLDGVQMGLAVGILFFCLQAPHNVYGPKSLFNFTIQTLHKVLQVTVISCSLFYGRKLRWPLRKKE